MIDQEKEIETYNHYCTVGVLLDFIEKYKISRDSKILTQRIEDVYFEKHNWTTIKKEGEVYNHCLNVKNNANNGVYDDKEQYPLMDKETLNKHKNMDLTPLLEEYIVVWSPVYYKDSKHLFLDCHY